jgi:hypothetical protein
VTHRNRTIVINSLLRAQTEIVRARTYLTDTADQTAQELCIDLNELLSGLSEIIHTVRKEDLA